MNRNISSNDIERANVLRLVRKGALLGCPLTGPMEVGIILTYACNYQCVFCALEHEEAGLKKSLEPDTAVHLIEDLGRLNTGQISFTGGGDPLCYRDVDRLVQVVRDNRMKCSVCTNGSLLSRERIDNWSGMGVHLAVSLNASDAATYSKIHPGTSKIDFNDLVQNIESYTRNAKEKGVSESIVSCNFVITKINFDQIGSMAKLAIDIGATQVQFRSIQPRPFHSHLFLDPDELAQAAEQVRNVRQNLAGKNGFTIQSSSLFESKSKVRARNPIHRFVCMEGVTASYIDSDGTVFPCCIQSTDIENHFMGNIHNEPFEDIWLGERYQQFRKDSVALDIQKSKSSENSCRHCPKAKHFQYLVNETAEGNLASLCKKALKETEKQITHYQERLSGPLPKSAFCARYDIRSELDEGKTGENIKIRIKVTNQGDFHWPGIQQTRRTPVGIGYHLLDHKKRMIRFDNNPRPYLESEVAPGDSQILKLEVGLPSESGKYILELDMVQETVAWFSQKGCPGIQIPIKVV